jgi:hypothetical protein
MPEKKLSQQSLLYNCFDFIHHFWLFRLIMIQTTIEISNGLSTFAVKLSSSPSLSLSHIAHVASILYIVKVNPVTCRMELMQTRSHPDLHSCNQVVHVNIFLAYIYLHPLVITRSIAYNSE